MCCSVATQTWSAHVVHSLLYTIHDASSMNAVWRTHIQRRPQTALLLLLYSTYFLAHAAASCLLHFSLSLYFSHLCLFSTKNKPAKLKGLLRVQPISGRRKDESQRGFISVRYSKHACDKNRRSSFIYSSISVFPPHPIPSSRSTKYAAYKTRNIFMKKPFGSYETVRDLQIVHLLTIFFKDFFLPLQPE